MTDVIAAAALLFSGISLILSIRTKRAQDQLLARQIQAHDRDLEARARANLTLSIRKGPSWKLVIRNEGPASASNVDLSFAGPQQLVPPSEFSRKLPMAIVTPGQEVELIASMAMGMPSKYDVRLAWHDSVDPLCQYE